MEKIVPELLGMLPWQITAIIAFIILGVGVFLYIKKSNMDERETNNSIEMRRIESLMAQISQLNTELSVTRKEMNDLYQMNLNLMIQLKEANQKIAALEAKLSSCMVRSQSSGDAT